MYCLYLYNNQTKSIFVCHFYFFFMLLHFHTTDFYHLNFFLFVFLNFIFCHIITLLIYLYSTSCSLGFKTFVIRSTLRFSLLIFFIFFIYFVSRFFFPLHFGWIQKKNHIYKIYLKYICFKVYDLIFFIDSVQNFSNLIFLQCVVEWHHTVLFRYVLYFNFAFRFLLQIIFLLIFENI